METQILEGTFAEVQHRLSALPLPPETRLRVMVTEATDAEADQPEPFTPTEFWNGVPLLPRRELPEREATEQGDSAPRNAVDSYLDRNS